MKITTPGAELCNMTGSGGQMENKDVLSMLFERGNAMQAFWGFYISVAFGLIAFFGSGHRAESLAILIAIAFLGFATVNCSGMYAIAKQRAALFQILTQPRDQSDESRTSSSSIRFASQSDLLDASRPPAPRGVVVFHVFADIAVLVGIWYLTRY
jgi:hypothetical protein